MTKPTDPRRSLAAEYLKGRTLEEALALWQFSVVAVFQQQLQRW